MNLVPLFIALAAVVAIAGGWVLFARTEAGRYNGAHSVAQSRSEIRLSMIVTHDVGPLVEEDYRMADINGLSTSEYRGVGRNGLAIKVDTLPRETYDVAFLFERAVSDGIWELQNRPLRGKTTDHYTIAVYQLTNNQHGAHRFSFTNPHYWATTGGHQFHLKLDRNKPVPDLIKMTSTVIVEPRYEKLVAEFSTFGSPAFRARILKTQARLRRPK